MKDHDPVHSPSHYTSGSVECIDAIEAALTPAEASGFRKGNAIKYIWRAGKKGDAVEDLKKAQWYLDREVFELEYREEGPSDPDEDAKLDISDTASVGSHDETNPDRPHRNTSVQHDARAEQLIRDTRQQRGFLS